MPKPKGDDDHPGDKNGKRRKTYGGRLTEGPFGYVDYHEYLEPGDNPKMNKYYGKQAREVAARDGA